MTLSALEAYGIDWSGQPKSIESVSSRQWDLIITVCDRAKEACPVMPGQPAFAHWGMDDPTELMDPSEKARAFTNTVTYLARRLDLLLSFPVETLERRALELRVQNIAAEVPIPRGVVTH